MNPSTIPIRPDVAGWHAALSSDHPLASAAGADVLRRGGNAIDAAVTMAAVIAVTRPHMNGLGGDGFLLYREAKTGQLFVLNGSGGAGSKATPEFFAARALTAIPADGILAVSVPGIVRMWQDAIERFGTLPLARALEPAIECAARGFVVSRRLNADIGECLPMVAADAEMARTYLDRDGNAPKPGTILQQPQLAATLGAIAADGADAFYTGSIARQIVAFMEREGGLLTAADLARHRSRWQEPIETTYLGHHVLACPPNTQGIALLEQLNIAEQFDLRAMGHNSAAYVHTLVEGCKRAFADRDAHVADPEVAHIPVDLLASKEHARALARTIGKLEATVSKSAAPRRRDGQGDTIYLCVVDQDGNAVSWIQSVFGVFGSGRMVPDTGILLHNRGSQFSLGPRTSQLRRAGKAAVSHAQRRYGAERRSVAGDGAGYPWRGRTDTDGDASHQQRPALWHDAARSGRCAPLAIVRSAAGRRIRTGHRE